MGCSLSKTNSNFQKAYNLGRLIGSGTYSQVRLCTHVLSGEIRCVKIMAKPYSVDDWKFEVALLTATSAGSDEIGADHVVRVFESFQDKHYLYTVMEYCQGGNLLLTKESNEPEILTECRVAFLLRQIMEGLVLIHSKGITHRDIRPENICFADTDRTLVKIIDFGLGYQMSKGEVLHEPCGTPEFLAPEMVLGCYGRKVDIWAYGVICYLMLFGIPPFVADTDEELLKKIVEQEPEYRTPTLGNYYEPSPAALDFLRQLLQKDFRMRPTAKDALQHPFLDLSKHNDQKPVFIPGDVTTLRRAGTKKLEQRHTQRKLGMSTIISGSSTSEDAPHTAKRHLFNPVDEEARLNKRKYTRVNVSQFQDVNRHVLELRGRFNTSLSQLLPAEEYNSAATVRQSVQNSCVPAPSPSTAFQLRALVEEHPGASQLDGNKESETSLPTKREQETEASLKSPRPPLQLPIKKAPSNYAKTPMVKPMAKLVLKPVEPPSPHSPNSSARQSPMKHSPPPSPMTEQIERKVAQSPPPAAKEGKKLLAFQSTVLRKMSEEETKNGCSIKIDEWFMPRG